MNDHPLHLSPLNNLHRELGARMVPFADYSMPILYSGILAEHEAVRTGCGVFDVSHMARFILRGSDARSILLDLTTVRDDKLESGSVVYAFTLNRSGGTIDDILIYQHNPEFYTIVANAGNHAAVARVFAEVEETRSEFIDLTEQTAMIAIQGPRALEALKAANPALAREAEKLKYYRFTPLDGEIILLSRTGYTGEDGFECFGDPGAVEDLFRTLVSGGICVPAGLGARDSLRLEACFSLYGHELSQDISPIEADQGWAVDMNRQFKGRRKLDERGKTRQICAFIMKDEGIPRNGCDVYDGSGTCIGFVSSGGVLPSLGERGGLCMVPMAFTAAGTEIFVEIRGQKKAAEIRPKPLKQPFGGEKEHEQHPKGTSV